MSNTRRAQPGAAFRQERFISSPEFQRGLMANLVAHRCTVLKRVDDRSLVWFLQRVSHEEGGFEDFVHNLLSLFQSLNMTASMQKFGAKSGQLYSAAQVKAIRCEIPDGDDRFLVSGEMSAIEIVTFPDVPTRWDAGQAEIEEVKARREEMIREAENQPTAYAASIFTTLCRQTAESELGDYLRELCLNPALKVSGGPWYFPTLVDTLRIVQATRIEERRRQVTTTGLGQQVYDTLDFALEGRCMVVIDGLARTGKTHAAKAWCEMNPGRARYVQVPATNDDIGFFRAIAKAIGVSINLNSKAQELRQRIEETLQGTDLILVFDEAHYLWPNGNYRLALPGRLNWIMTALVNCGVPVGLITTPQFFKGQRAVEQRTHWTSEQFIGRIGHYEKLPDSLPESDLFAVGKAFLPEGDAVSIEMLVRYAQASAKYLAAIETVTRRARFLAKRAGRSQVSRIDVKQAVMQGVIPSDSALAQALNPSSNPRRRANNSTVLAVPHPEPAHVGDVPGRSVRPCLPDAAEVPDRRLGGGRKVDVADSSRTRARTELAPL